MKATDQWGPGLWCGAALKLCDGHVVDVSEDEAIRYPEQWMYVLWRPTDLCIPFQRPDGWGLTVGHPRDTMTNCLPPEAEIYILSDLESVWSSWLQIPLVCERYEPWLVGKIETRRDEQRQLEASRYAQWYGAAQASFETFLWNLGVR